MICVSLSHISQIPGIIESGVELVELRLDLIREDPVEIYSLLQGKFKTIATYRPVTGSNEERISALKACMDMGASFVDIEMESDPGYLEILLNHSRSTGCDPIISYHNFEATPVREELYTIMNQCYRQGGVVAKIATLVNSDEDIINLLSLYKNPGRKVVLGMGTGGRITRVVAPYLGAEFTFASTGTGGETAPGQLTVQHLKDIYKIINEK